MEQRFSNAQFHFENFTKQKQNNQKNKQDKLKNLIKQKILKISAAMIVSKACGCFSQQQILDSVQNCVKHDSPYMYLCLDPTSACRANPLMCPTCIQDHKGHNFESITNYFTAETRHILKTGTSSNGQAVARLNDHVFSDITKMKTRLNNQMNKISVTCNRQITRLRMLYPLENKFGISGTEINTNNISQLINIVEKQKNHIWVPATEKYIRSLLGTVNTMLGNLLIDLQQHINGMPWETLDLYKAQMLVDQFIKRYEDAFDPQHNYFLFSGQQKHDNVRLSQERLIAKFVDTIPSKPAVLTDNPFTRKHDTVFFKMMKVQKSFVLFDASVVLVGACVPVTAKVFGYRNLLEPTHGAYMIGSNGKSYHSSLDKYNKRSEAFSFTEKDVIRVRIDYDKKMIKFSKWGFFQRNFEMELNVKDDDLDKLKPCVLFHGERGAMVKIVQQPQYKHIQIDMDEVI